MTYYHAVTHENREYADVKTSACLRKGHTIIGTADNPFDCIEDAIKVDPENPGRINIKVYGNLNVVEGGRDRRLKPGETTRAGWNAKIRHGNRLLSMSQAFHRMLIEEA